MKLPLLSSAGVVCLIPLLLAACAPAPTATPVTLSPTAIPVTVLSTATPAVIASATPTLPPTTMPTSTPAPTASATPMPEPTSTPMPTATPTPMPTATPTSTTTPTPMPTAAHTPTTTPTPIPTQTVTLTPSPTPDEGPIIAYFRANVTEADPGDTITLQWRSSGGNQASLYHLMSTGQLGHWWEVEPTGSMDYDIPAESRNWEGFVLFVLDEAERVVQATLQVNLRCPDTWFFSPAPDECPSSPSILTDGAEQHFEHGLMLWSGAEDWIYVLFDDGAQPAYKVLLDEWDESKPESDPSIVPPAGLYQPVRGFGLVWREETGIRDRLGWALGEEAGYPTAIQRTSRPKYNVMYIKALDGGVWELGPELSNWRHIS